MSATKIQLNIQQLNKKTMVNLFLTEINTNTQLKQPIKHSTKMQNNKSQNNTLNNNCIIMLDHDTTTMNTYQFKQLETN